jgi:hypothetical protein
MDPLLERYYRTFGWAPWQDFDHVPPVHHNTEWQGRPVEYSLRGAEVYVGSLNFELLKPLPGGESLFHDHLRRKGEGIASIASMFHEREDGDAVKVAFKEAFGLEVINKANIGEHIEYYYLDTERDFGCPIESGSGHAIDFVGPARIYPRRDALPGPSPDSGIEYRITQVTLVVRDLDAKIANYHRGFGWGPWRVFDSRDGALLSDATFHGEPAEFGARFAQAKVGDLNFEIVEPLGGRSPWQDFLDRQGEGLMGIAVVQPSRERSEAVKTQFAGYGVGVLASAVVGGTTEWFLLDTRDGYKTLIASGTGHAFDEVSPVRVYPG